MLILEAASAAASAPDLDGLVEEISAGFHLPRIAVSAILAAAVFIAAKIISAVARKMFRDLAARSAKFTPIMASLVSRMTMVLIWIIAIIAILGLFGIDLTPVLAGLGITGVVLGFALQESISSLFSGIMIAINRPFRVGDWVDIGDISGTVKSMDLMCVTLASGDNKKITMNNKNVWGSTIINYSFIDRRRLDMKVSIRYSDDIETAKEVILSLILSYKEVLRDPAPLVEVGNYADSSIDIYVRPWVAPSDYWPVCWRFNSEILPTLQSHGIDMPFSQLTVTLQKN